MKKGFSLLELIFVISIVGIIVTHSIQKDNLSKIKIAKNQILLHLKYARYIAMLDNKYDYEDTLWHKKRWSFLTSSLFKIPKKESLNIGISKVF